MTYKPPFQLPTQDGTDVGAPVIQQPILIQHTIDASQHWFDTVGKDAAIQVGDNIIDFYSSNITQFVQSQRAQNALGGMQQAVRYMGWPGLDAAHFRNQGLEYLKLTARPENATSEITGLSVEMNFDGYCAWVHQWARLPDPTVVDNSPVDIIINGYAAQVNFTPDDGTFQNYQDTRDPAPPAAQLRQSVQMIIVAFGQTALRCQSLQDDAKNNRFASTPASGGLVNSILPPRKDIEASGKIPAHKDLPGYFVFDWGNGLNPDSWAYESKLGSGNDYTYKSNFPKEAIVKIIQFKNALDSPLIAQGKNQFRSQFNSTPPKGLTGQNADDFVCAEFYDRQELRAAFQSWRQPTSATSVILVNDKPRYWLADGGDPFSDIGAKTNMELDFDLTPQKDPPNALTFGRSFTQALVFHPVTAAQQAVIDANAAAASAHGAALLAAQTALTAAQVAVALAASNILALQDAFVLVAYQYALTPTTAIFNELLTTFGQPETDHLIAYAQAGTLFKAAPTNTTYAANFVAAENAMGGSAGLVVNDFLNAFMNAALISYATAYQTAYNKAIANGATTSVADTLGHNALDAAKPSVISTEAALSSYATSIGQTALAAALDTAITSLYPAEDAYIAALSLASPEHIQSDNFQTIDQFNHRIITVTDGDQFQIGPWSQG